MMKLPSTIILVLGLLLGVGCGSSAKLIPSGNAGPLQNDLQAISDALSGGDCAHVDSAIKQARSDLDSLPPTVDPQLRSSLTSNLATLASRAPRECHQQTTNTQTSTSQTQTQTQTTTQTSSTSTPTTTTSTSSTTTPTATSTSSSSTVASSTLPNNGGGAVAPGGTGVAPSGGNPAGGGN